MNNQLKLHTPEYIDIAVSTLESAGFEAYLVGGCVRDSLLGVSPNDWDIATSALPEETEKVFSDYKTTSQGIKHGTITLIIDSNPIEITTFRSESTYSDFRRPDSVNFSKNIKDDLSRRDFTINAMAYSKRTGLIDLFGGQDDLKQKTIRCVGDPFTRFSEDALRILRCLRFASQLGFSIENNTRIAANETAPLLKRIANERIQDEFIKLICGKNPVGIMRENSEIIFVFMPELRPLVGCEQEHDYHIYTVWEHTLKAVEGTPPIPEVRLAALFHDCGKPNVKTYGRDSAAHFYSHASESMLVADSIMNRLHFPNKLRHDVITLIRHHDEILPMTEKCIKKLLSKLTQVQMYNLFYLIKADVLAQNPKYAPKRLEMLESAKRLTDEIIAQGECVSLSTLNINGNDLLEIGYTKGEEIGYTLNALLDMVIENKLTNEHNMLIDKAKSLLKSFI